MESAHTVAATAVVLVCVIHKPLQVFYQQARREATAGFGFAEKIPWKGDVLSLLNYCCLAEKASAWRVT